MTVTEQFTEHTFTECTFATRQFRRRIVADFFYFFNLFEYLRIFPFCLNCTAIQDWEAEIARHPIWRVF